MSNPFQDYSLDCKDNILGLAVKNKNLEIVKLILDFEEAQTKKKDQRVKLSAVNLDFQGTGTPSKH